jgi:hypothetical protein
LQDAHQRVMSLATVQQQLHASGLHERIEIGPYLSKLCDSLAALMIGERRLVIHPPHAAHTAARHGRRTRILLRPFGNHRFSCYQETGDGTRVL